MSGGFFRGTSADQDSRFSNKTAKLLKTQKFAPELDQLVDMTKVKMDVMRPWIATRVTELLGFEDEVLINFIYGLLEGKNVDGKQVQIQITGFMEKNTGKFMKELWSLLTSAQKNMSGIPLQFLEKKAEETRKNKAEDLRIMSELQRSHEEMKDAERERIRKQDAGLDDSKAKLNGSPRRERSLGGDNERAGNGMVESQAYRTRTRSDPRLPSRSPSRSPRPTRKRNVSPSPSRSPVRRSPPRHRSRSPVRRRRSPIDIQRHRSRSPLRRPRSPVGRRRYSRSPLERSPIAAPRSPRRRRSPATSISPRGRSPPRRRHSPVYSRASPRRRKSPAWSPRHRRRISPRYGRSPPRRYTSPPGRGRHASISPPRYPDRSPRKHPLSLLPSSPPQAAHTESPERSPSPQKPRQQRTGRRSPSLSPSPPHQGDRSPSPLQREKSPSPNQRLPSPVSRRQRARTPSPRRQRDSPRRHMAHSPSPQRQRALSPSPRRQRACSPSPRCHRQSSPAHRRLQSPGRGQQRMDSPLQSRHKRRSPSPRQPSSPRSKVTSPSAQHPPSVSRSLSQQSYEAHESESPSPNKCTTRKDHRAASSPVPKGISSRHGASPSLSPPFRRSPGISGSSRSCSRSPRPRRSNIEQLDRRAGVKTSDSQRTREKPRKRTRSPSRERLSMYDDRHYMNSRSGISSVAHIVRKDDSGQSGSEDDQHRSPEEEWRQSKDVEGDDDYDGNMDDRKSAKKRRKEEKRLRKEEKRRKREERHRRKEEKRANRTSRCITSVTPPPDLENRVMRNDSAEDDAPMEAHEKLENELRKKALDSLKAKKNVSS